jgi:hypothetical protein
MAGIRSSLYARRMTNRETIERLRQEVDIDYAFGITGLLTLADAVDDLIERVDALERRTDATQPIVIHDIIARIEALEKESDNQRVDGSADVVAALSDLRRQIVKLTKVVKKRRI